MGGHGLHPPGWTVLALVLVAYAHVILALAGAALALAIAVRILTADPTRMLVNQVISRRIRVARASRPNPTPAGDKTGGARCAPYSRRSGAPWSASLDSSTRAAGRDRPPVHPARRP
jgi:hypothetical protein